MKYVIRGCFFAVWMFLAFCSRAEVLVVGSPSLKSEDLTYEVLSNIYYGQSNTLPSGVQVVPVDQASDSSVRSEFYKKVMGKTIAQMKSHWARLIFTGKGVPPAVVLGDAEVIRHVATSTNAIAYVSDKADTSAVKVLLRVP